MLKSGLRPKINISYVFGLLQRLIYQDLCLIVTNAPLGRVIQVRLYLFSNNFLWFKPMYMFYMI